MARMDKMAGEARKAYPLVWLRASTNQFAIRALSFGWGEMTRSLCRKPLKVGRRPAGLLLNLAPFPSHRFAQINGS